MTNVASGITPSSHTVTGSYAIAYDATTSFALSGTVVTSQLAFVTFDNKSFEIPWPASSETILIEAPCTSATSTFDY